MCVLAHWLLALKPEVSSDGLAMHLAIPGMIADQGRFAFDFHQYTWSLMPMGGDFAFTAAYLTRRRSGGAAAQLCAIRGDRRDCLSNFTTLAAGAESRAGGGAVCVHAAGGAGQRIVVRRKRVGGIHRRHSHGAGGRRTGGRGIAAGRGVRDQGGDFGVSASGRGDRRNEVKGPMAIGSGRDWRLFVVLAAPPYFNAWMKTGNPVFPFENQVFHSPDFETSGTLQDVRYKPSPAWNALYMVTFRSSDHIEGQDGALGFQYFLLLPALLILWNRRAPGALIAFALTGAVISFVSLPNIRYLYPALPLLSIGFAWLLSEIPAMATGMVALITLNLYFFAAAGWYQKSFAVFTRAQWNEYMTISGPQRELVAILNRTVSGRASGVYPRRRYRRAARAGLLRYVAHLRVLETDDRSRRSCAGGAAEFKELGIRHLITPIPVETEYAVVQNFVNEWTAPSGGSCGKFELRRCAEHAAAKKMEDVEPAGAGAYDDRDSRIEYTGAWLPDRQFKQASSGTITYSNVPGDSFKLYFTGRSIEYVYTKALNRGTAEVWIDRKKRAAIDQYSESIEWQQRTVFSGLASGPHTIEVRVDWGTGMCGRRGCMWIWMRSW